MHCVPIEHKYGWSRKKNGHERKKVSFDHHCFDFQSEVSQFGHPGGWQAGDKTTPRAKEEEKGRSKMDELMKPLLL